MLSLGLQTIKQSIKKIRYQKIEAVLVDALDHYLDLVSQVWPLKEHCSTCLSCPLTVACCSLNWKVNVLPLPTLSANADCVVVIAANIPPSTKV
jgi:hypothetical protein